METKPAAGIQVQLPSASAEGSLTYSLALKPQMPGDQANPRQYYWMVDTQPFPTAVFPVDYIGGFRGHTAGYQGSQ